MIRLLLAVLLLAALPQAAGAQPPPVALTAAQSQQALDMLKDPAKRAQLISVLEAIAKATPAATRPSAAAATPAAPAATTPAAPAAAPVVPAAPAEPAAEASPIQLAPDSLGAQLIVDASSRLGSLSDDLIAAARTATDFPLLLNFAQQLVNDPWSRQMLFDTAWRLVLVFAAGLAAQWLVRRLLRRPSHALEQRARPSEEEPEPGIARAEAGETEPSTPSWPTALTVLRRLPAASGRLVLLLLPVVAFTATGYGILGTSLGAQPISRLVIVALMDAYALCRAVTSLLRAIAGPGQPSLLPLPDSTAQYALRWVRRIAAVGIFGYAITEVGLLFGLYRIAHDALIKLVVLVIYLFLSIVILQNRTVVAGWIRARPDATGFVAAVRNRLAKVWHLAAIFYVLALWTVWALEVPRGFSRLLQVVVLTALVIAVARQAVALAHGAIDRWSRVTPDVAERYPGLDQRLGAYHPIARAVVHLTVWAAAFVAVLQVWQVDAVVWFTSGHLGARLLSALGTIGVTLLISLAVWEGTNTAIQRHLARLAREAQLARSARLRTLLPMLRTALLILICLVSGLMVLSEIGVNIAPLLAGAGVIGIAIGFGSQKLVQDVITGLFLLLENTMQVGDAVTLGGLSGSIETLSVRTIRLRAVDGSVHIIPFSAVTTVTNMTRDFGYAVLDIPVGLDEQPDRITDILRDIAQTMRAETKWHDVIRDDIEIFGVDRFIPNAYVITARMKTTAGQRWAVRRELLRRIKQNFDHDAIDSPLTSWTVLDRPPPTLVAVNDHGGS
jgi:small-conductance mechanosensitive channel